MNRATKKELPNISISSSNGTTRISNLSTSLMNENGQLVYRRSPIQNQTSQQQPQSFDTLGSPSQTSYNSEEVSENTNSNSFEDEDNINELSQKIDLLQRQIEVLTETQTTQDERYKRSRQENDALLSRIHGLEDQIREIELTSDARAKEDEKRFRETMAKQIKTQSQECEQHLHANFLLQQDVFSLKNDLSKSESLIKTLRNEKEALELELQDKNNELVNLDEENHKLKLLVKNLKDEENVKSNLISILNEELEDSHNRSQRDQHNQINDNHQSSGNHSNTSNDYSNHANQSPKQRISSSRRSSLNSGVDGDYFFNSTTTANNKALKDIDGLEMSLSKLRDENKKLKEANEELQAQLLNLQLEEGRSLVQEGNKSYSLADEMGDIDVQRLMEAFKEQQDDITRLKTYIDQILLKIVNEKPDILDKTVSQAETSTNNKSTNESND